jgi:hypothetical protein
LRFDALRDPAELKSHGHHAGAAKTVAIESTYRPTGWTRRAIGEYDGCQWALKTSHR